MATSIANVSMLRSSNLPPSAHSPPTQSKRAVEALPSGWPPNNSKPRIHLQKTNNQASRSFLAYLAYRAIFFQDENAGRGAYLSFLSQSAFFFRKALAPDPRLSTPTLESRSLSCLPRRPPRPAVGACRWGRLRVRECVGDKWAICENLRVVGQEVRMIQP
jgi:hypothetical protein